MCEKLIGALGFTVVLVIIAAVAVVMMMMITFDRVFDSGERKNNQSLGSNH